MISWIQPMRGSIWGENARPDERCRISDLSLFHRDKYSWTVMGEKYYLWPLSSSIPQILLNIVRFPVFLPCRLFSNPASPAPRGPAFVAPGAGALTGCFPGHAGLELLPFRRPQSALNISRFLLSCPGVLVMLLQGRHAWTGLTHNLRPRA